MKKSDRIIYYIVTGLFTAQMLFAIFTYLFNTEMVAEMFTSLGVPQEVIYPLSLAKFLGLVAIWTNKSRMLKELAYACFALDFVMAATAHAMAGDGGAPWLIAPLALVSLSFIFHRRVFPAK